MIERKTLLRAVVVLVVAVLIGYGTGVRVVHNRMVTEVALSKEHVSKQLATLTSLSEVLNSGGADAITDSVIKDCSAEERNRFDTLLARLNDTMPRAELDELSRLFDRCGDFYALRKALTVSRFEREISLFSEYVAQYVRLSHQNIEEPLAVEKWKALSGLEKEQSQHFDRLVGLQGEIIKALVANNSLQSDALKTLLKEVEEEQQMQVYNLAKMKELRANLPTSI